MTNASRDGNSRDLQLLSDGLNLLQITCHSGHVLCASPQCHELKLARISDLAAQLLCIDYESLCLFVFTCQ